MLVTSIKRWLAPPVFEGAEEKTRQASLINMVCITSFTANIGTIRAATAEILLFWVLMTGLIFDLRCNVIGTIAASMAVLGLIVAENAGWLRQPFYDVGVTQWVTFTTLFGFTSGLT